MERSAGMIELLKGLRKPGGIRWAVTLASDDSIMGTCGFHNWKREHARGGRL